MLSDLVFRRRSGSEEIAPDIGITAVVREITTLHKPVLGVDPHPNSFRVRIGRHDDMTLVVIGVQ